MPTAPMFFGNNQESGDQALAGASALAINVLIDGKGAVRRRPGLSMWTGFPATIPATSQIDGIDEFEGDAYWVNAARTIYRLDPATAVATDLSTAGINSTLDGQGRPMFAKTPFRLAIAGGGLATKVDSGAAVAARLTSFPSTQIVALASRLFTDDLTDKTAIGKIRASGTGQTDELTFDPLNVISAEARPDAIVSLTENANEAFAIGSSTVQVFSPDATAILAPGRAVNRGSAAAFSVIKVDEDLAWFTDLKRFVIGDGRSLNDVSAPIGATLDDMTEFSDMWGFRLNMDQFDCLVWACPSDGRTWCYQNGGGWSQWHTWNGNGQGPFAVTAHHLLSATKTHLAGLATGQIVKFDSAATTDLGQTIKAEVTSGFQNRDTDAVKHCREARLTFKRGTATATEPHVLLSWRDDLGGYCDPIRIGLGTTGDNVFTVRLNSLGAYRARDWKMEFTAAADFVLARAEEVFSIEGGD